MGGPAAFSVALVENLTPEQEGYYRERGNLLATKSIRLSKQDIGVLQNGFNFDIRDSNTNAQYDVPNSLQGSVDQIERRISMDLIVAPAKKAFVSATLIECLLAICSPNSGPSLTIDSINGGFGTSRQDGSSGSRPNVSGSQSSSITDHAFGRGFDIMSIYSAYDQVERKYARNLSKITSKEGYQYQLDLLLKKLNSIPQHLVPDYMAISAQYTDPEYDTYENLTSIVGIKYPNLKYLKIKRDTSGVHNNHIHISFAATRGGTYVGPNGVLQIAFSNTALSKNPAILVGSADTLERKITIASNDFTRDYSNNTSLLDPQIIFKALVDYGQFTPELAACFVAIAERESRRRIYVVQEVYGAIGLWQVSTVPKDGGMGEAYLEYPDKQKVIYWQLALPEKAGENLTEDQIKSLINERCRKNIVRIDLFDKRCWNLVNQISLVRSKMNFKGSKNEVDGLSNRVGAWGDTYWNKDGDSGWIRHLKFSHASSIYTKMTRKKRR